MQIKKCPKCQKIKPIEDYYADNRTKDGKCHTCKPCHEQRYKTWKRANRQKVKGYNKKWWQSKGHYSRYALTKEQYDMLIRSQNGVCKICGNPETTIIRGELRPLHIDHDHKTGSVRGLLCSACNTGLGKFRDNPDYLEAAARYVRG